MPPHFEAVSLPHVLNAVGLTWAADGTMFVIEKHGFVRVLNPAEQLQGSPFIDLSGEVNNNGDRGMLGIALMPGFVPDGGATSWVYLLYTVSPVPGQDMTFNQNNQYSFSRLTRYKAITQSGSIVADLSTRHVLLGNQLADGSVPDCIASLHDSHSNGAIRFGSDGTLLLATGDGAHYDFQDNGGADVAGFDTWTHPQTGLKGPTPIVQDEGSFRSQDPRSLSGKILRLDPATGLGLASNPFYDGNPASHRSRVFALGLRNPFRMNRVEGTGSTDPNAAQPGVLLIGDVGWNTWEELNACTTAATNFGWPCFEGVPVHSGYNNYTSADPNKVTCHTPVNGTFKSPIAAWHHGTSGAYYPPNTHLDDNDNPLTGFKGSCSIGGAVYTGPNYPAKYNGRLFVADFVGQWIKNVEFDANWNVTKIHDFASNTGLLVSIERHPISGDLYAVSATTNKIIHIRYTQNYTPVAVANASPLVGSAPLLVTFSAVGSSDADGDPLAYDWDFGDGSAHGTGVSVQHTYVVGGLYNAVLTVSDTFGAFDAAPVQIGVGNVPPIATILTPSMGQTYLPPTTLSLSGSGSDVENGALTFTWNVDLYHDTHVHSNVFSASGPNVQFPISTSPEDPELHYYKIRLTVTDPGGLMGTAHVFVYPQEHVHDFTGTSTFVVHVDDFTPPGSFGGGNPDKEVARDNVSPAVGATDALAQFTTSHNGLQGDDDWFGYILAEAPSPEFRFTKVTFQEGLHWSDGGWFESFNVEVRVNGTWTPVNALVTTPSYPFASSAQPGFDGVPFNTYQLSFDPIAGDGVRIRGNPGGSNNYFSVAELRAYGITATVVDPHHDITVQGTIIAKLFSLTPPTPSGAGNPDPETIRNGTYPPLASASDWGQFDTSHNGDQGASDWIGYDFGSTHTIDRVVYQEGRDTALGGAFSQLDVEVQQTAGGPWVSVGGLTSTPAFPGANGIGYETFTLDFTPVLARAIRIVGAPSGSLGFVSVGELRVFEPAAPPGAGFVPYGTNLGGANLLTFSSATPPGLGLPIELVISGAVGPASGNLLLGTQSAMIPLAGGTLLIHPNLLLFTPIPYDADGKCVIDTAVPDDPTLAGVSIELQAMAMRQPAPYPVRWSNGLHAMIFDW